MESSDCRFIGWHHHGIIMVFIDTFNFNTVIPNHRVLVSKRFIHVAFTIYIIAFDWFFSLFQFNQEIIRVFITAGHNTDTEHLMVWIYGNATGSSGPYKEAYQDTSLTSLALLNGAKQIIKTMITYKKTNTTIHSTSFIQIWNQNI